MPSENAPSGAQERCRKPGCGALKGRCMDWDCPEGFFAKWYNGKPYEQPAAHPQDDRAALVEQLQRLDYALRVMVNVFRPRDGKPGSDQHVEVEACTLADDALRYAADATVRRALSAPAERAEPAGAREAIADYLQGKVPMADPDARERHAYGMADYILHLIAVQPQREGEG